MTRHSCPRVSFLGPDSTRQNVDPTRPSIADQKSESTRPDPSPYPSPMASHKKISTNFNAFKIHWHVSLQILQNINTSIQHSKNYTGFLSNKESITKSVFSHTNQKSTYLYNSLSFPSRSVSTRFSDSFVLSIPYVRSSLGKRAFSVIGPRLRNSLPPDTRNSSSLPIFSSRLKLTLLQNYVPSLGSFPSPLTVYPDFDSCNSPVMPPIE